MVLFAHFHCENVVREMDWRCVDRRTDALARLDILLQSMQSKTFGSLKVPLIVHPRNWLLQGLEIIMARQAAGGRR